MKKIFMPFALLLGWLFSLSANATYLPAAETMTAMTDELTADVGTVAGYGWSFQMLVMGSIIAMGLFAKFIKKGSKG